MTAVCRVGEHTRGFCVFQLIFGGSCSVGRSSLDVQGREYIVIINVKPLHFMPFFVSPYCATIFPCLSDAVHDTQKVTSYGMFYKPPCLL